MIGFIIGLFVGGCFGVFTMALCAASKRADDELERIHFNKEVVDNTEVTGKKQCNA